MDYAINPYTGVGSIKFGMKPEEVHKKLGDDFEQQDFEYIYGFREIYMDFGIFVHYDKQGTCNAIELVSIGKGEAIIEGQDLLEMSFTELYKFCKKNDIDVVLPNLQHVNFISVIAQFFIRARVIILITSHMDDKIKLLR